MNVLITDGENRSSLAATRSLGRNGCRVVVTSKNTHNLSSCSRYCNHAYRIPDSKSTSNEYAYSIAEIVKRESIDFIFPMTELSIYLLNPFRDLFLDNTVLACAPTEPMHTVSDKVTLFRLAEKLGVPVPKTLYLKGPDDLPSRIEKIEHYPIVVKPMQSMIPAGHEFVSGRICYANSQSELERLYATQKALRFPSMIQEKIVGPGTGLFTLYARGSHQALFSHRRLREKPPSGGVSVVSESVPLDEEMVESSSRILSAVGWNGVAMVEFKRDERDGKAKLMEINGRFWGSLQLAITCGVDFPRLLLDHLKGESPVSTINEYCIGHKMKWFLGTLDHLLIRLRNSNEELNLLPGSPNKWKAVMDFLKIRERDTSFDVIDPDDMGPFWFEGRSYIRHLLNFKH